MSEARASRPRRSRLGLGCALVLGGLVALEVLGAVQPKLLPTTPAAFLSASWAVATGDVGAAEDAELKQKVAFRPLPYVMWGLRPGFTRDTAGGLPLRTSNSLGFRGPEIELPKPVGRTRILCLGGSTTYAFAVDDEDAYPRVLERTLRAAGHDVDVINGGVESYTSAESLANLAYRGLQLEPDLVVVYHAANDVRPRRYANYAPDYSHYRRNWNGSVAGYQQLQGELGGMNQFLQYPPPTTEASAEELLARHGSVAFRRHLTSLAALARAHDIQPVFVSFARHPAPSDSGLAVGIDEHNQLLRALSPELDVPLIDLAAEFPTEAALFADDIHLLVEGNRIKAEAIAEGLSALLP